MSPASATLSVVLIVASIGKALSFEKFRANIEHRVGSHRYASGLAAGVLGLELLAGVLIWTRARPAVGLGLVGFMLGASVWLLTGNDVHSEVDLRPCQCMGLPDSMSFLPSSATVALRPAGWALRNGAIAGLSLQVAYPIVPIHLALAGGVVTTSVVSIATITWVIQKARGGLPDRRHPARVRQRVSGSGASTLGAPRGHGALTTVGAARAGLPGA